MTFTCHQANENKESKEEILEFMKTADIGIEDFVVSKETALVNHQIDLLTYQ
jgi:arsenate reductase-like glutaredoxin family protein